MYPTRPARLASKISHLSTIFSLVLVVVATLLSVTCSQAAGRTVRVGVYDTKPLAYSDKDGTAHGFFVDMLNRVAEKEQWDMQYVPGTWQEGLDRLKSDKIDMVLCIGYTEAREKFMDFPKEYLLLDWGLIFKTKGSKISSLLDLEGKSVSALKGDVYLTGFKELVRQFNVNVKIQEVDQYSEVFKAVESGAVAAGVNGNLYGMLNDTGLNLEQTPIIFTPVKLGYAVNTGKNGDLIAALDRDIAEMKADKASIYNRELEHLLGKKNHNIPKEAYWALSGVAAALFLAIGFIVLLKRQVKAKTSHLVIEINERKRAEEDLLEHKDKLQQQNEELQMAEEELRSQNDELLDAEWKFRALFDNGPIGVAYHSMIYDEAGNPVDYFFIDANDNFITLTGVDPRNKTVTQAFPGIKKDQFDWIGTFGRVAKTGETIHFEQYLQFNNRWYDLVAYQYKPDHFVASFVEITKRKQAEEQLKIQSQRLQLATSSARLAVWDWNVRDNQMHWDDRMFELYGITRETFPNSVEAWLNGLHPEDKDAAVAASQAALNGEQDFNTLFRVLHPDGTVKHIRANALVIRGGDGIAERMIGINYDITESIRLADERRELENQLLFAQKMESLGVLAGGIAHDFNNILAIIMGNCSLAKMDSDNAGNYIPEIEKASDRAAALCRQMLAYAGKAQIVKSTFDLVGLVDEMVKMLRSSLPQNAVIKQSSLVDIPSVSGDASQIRQIVMNLIINASEAIGESQGEIQVSLTKTAIKDGQQAKDHQGNSISPGWYVCLEVTDNGCGMDNETRQRIFEPFYTTKFTGRGLGMSAVLGIITSHGGALQLFSQTGQGTTFKVYLPIQISESAGGEGTPQTPLTAWQGSGTILLAEDEDQVRLIAKALINMLGFTVIEASNGKEALELYRQNSADITLVVTDMGMPVMNGYELFRELKKLRSELPIIISSGFGDVDVTSKIARNDIAGIIGKPYGFDQLREVLKGVMEGTG
jgi:signal transduction histidine kinase/ABC-type amino acid transport substrate-binding protein/CheY-like chemotaxis protein